VQPDLLIWFNQSVSCSDMTMTACVNSMLEIASFHEHNNELSAVKKTLRRALHLLRWLHFWLQSTA